MAVDARWFIIHTYSGYENKVAENIGKIVEIAKSAGAECIEWGGDIHVTDIETAKKANILCNKAGIRICSYGSYYRVGSKNSGEWKNICEIANIMGAKSVRVWLGKSDSEKTDELTKVVQDIGARIYQEAAAAQQAAQGAAGATGADPNAGAGPQDDDDGTIDAEFEEKK